MEEVGQAAVGSACATDQDCATGTPCLIAVCDPNAHVCQTTTTNAACDDGKACTTNDACAAGACVGGGAAPGCSPCQAAAVLPPEGGAFTGAVSGASALQGSCATSGGSPERVYSWTPARSGLATFSTCGGTTSFDTVVYLLDGTCKSSAEVACNDDTPGCGTSDGLPNGENHGSRASFNVVAGHQYFVVVDGWGGRAGNYTLVVTPPSVCGNGVREGSEQCDGADASACSGHSCTATCTCSVPPAGLPDLVPSISNVTVQLNATVGAGDVAEGCAAATTGNSLLVFSTIVSNRGTVDLVLGDPGCPNCATHPLEACTNPAFVCSPAGGHDHGHYSNYAFYELLDASGTLVAAGHKQGFCVRDNTCTSGAPTYTCDDQGIGAGCSDVYAAGLGCQYIDIGGVPPGQYMLRVRVDPFDDFVELDETNNDAMVPVTIPGTPTPEIIPAAGGTFQGTTSGASTQSGTCASSATASAPEHIFRWTPSASGTATIQTCGTQGTFDTVLYIRTALTGGTELACNDDTNKCSIGDGSHHARHRGSIIKPTVTAGHTYYIIVDGYAGSSSGSQGSYIVTVTPPAP